MDRPTKRLGLAGLATLTIASISAGIYPRVSAWNQASNAALIAGQRATNCRVLNGSLVANTIPVDEHGRPLPAGTHVCDWNGMTGQATATGAIGYLKQGNTEEIIKTLESRGFKLPHQRSKNERGPTHGKV